PLATWIKVFFDDKCESISLATSLIALVGKAMRYTSEFVTALFISVVALIDNSSCAFLRYFVFDCHSFISLKVVSLFPHINTWCPFSAKTFANAVPKLPVPKTVILDM